MKRKNNKKILKAFLLSAAFLAIPGTLLADRADISRESSESSDFIKIDPAPGDKVDFFENQESLDSLFNQADEEKEGDKSKDSKEKSHVDSDSGQEESPHEKSPQEKSPDEKSSDIVVGDDIEKRAQEADEKAPGLDEDEAARAGAGLEKGEVKTAVRSIQAPPNYISSKKLAQGYFYDDKGNIIKNRWVEFRGHYYFPDGSGVRYLNCFIHFGIENTFYMDKDGRQYRGLLSLGDKRYLLDDYSAILRRDNAWVVRDDGRYFPNANGELYHNQYITFGANNAHYLDDQGRERRGVSRMGNDLVLFDEAKGGRARKDNAWVIYKGKYYFPNDQGRLYNNQFISFGATRYYMGQDGSRQYGPVKVGSEYYYMDDKTGISQGKIKPGFNMIQGRSYYFDPSSLTLRGESQDKRTDWKNLRNQAVKEGADYYYIGSNGIPVSGFYETGGKLYFYDPSQSNRRRRAPGKFSWQGREYYVQLDSSIARNDLIVVDKKVYQADRNGALTRSYANMVLDISRYQKPEDINYDLLSRNISGVILRAGFTGYGTGNSYYKDATFDRHYKEFQKRGVPIGAYWYSCADTPDEGQAEAEFMLNILKGKRFEMPIYWDTEDQYHQAKVSPQQLTDTGIAFLDKLEKSGYYVGIYGSASWLDNKLEMKRLNKYDVWVAHYGVSKPRYKGDYSMWQFTSSYRMQGYDYNLDANLSYKNYPSIIRGAGLNNTR